MPAGGAASARDLVVEAVRFDSPVQLVGRVAVEEVRLDDVTIAPGQKILLHLGAANRDPAVFAEPGEFRPGRGGPAPIAFGVGSGQCLGQNLAVRSAVTFLEVLSTRSEWLRVNHDARRLSGLSGRGFHRLPGRRHRLHGRPSTEGAA